MFDVFCQIVSNVMIDILLGALKLPQNKEKCFFSQKIKKSWSSRLKTVKKTNKQTQKQQTNKSHFKRLEETL